MKVHETVRVTAGPIVHLIIGLIMVPIIGLRDRNAGSGGANE